MLLCDGRPRGIWPFSEALHAGRIGLWRAIQGYDPERGLAFSTYTWKLIMRRIWREVKLAERDYERGHHNHPFGQIPNRCWRMAYQ